MNTADSQHAGLAPLDTLIKPNQVQGIPSIPPEQKQYYINGITKIWERIQSNPQHTSEYVEAHKKLMEVSKTIKNQMIRWRQENAAHASQVATQNGGRPLNQNQPGHTQWTNNGPGLPAAPPGQPAEQYSEKTMQTVKSLNLIVPPQFVAQGPEVSTGWMNDAKRKYAMYMHRFEISSLKLHRLSQEASQRQQQGNPLSPEETNNYTQRKNVYQQQMQEARELLNKFKKQQEAIRAHQPNPTQGGSQGLQTGNIAGDTMNQSVQQHPAFTATQSNEPRVQIEQHGLPFNQAVDAVKNQPNQTVQQANTSTGQQGQTPMSQPQNPQAQNPVIGAPTSQAPQTSLNFNTSAPPSQQHHSPQTAQSQMASSQGPHPLSHKAAMAQVARSYSQPNVSQSTPQSSTHAHPQMGSREQQNNNAKMPIPKTLNVPLPQPVGMGPARPTLSGGPSTGAMGPMGQPAIQKHPGYVLEGEGERVLSKKKLEELVRQVTGGGDGEGGETLDPDVEETLLDVADEFVDNVIMAACRLAKLRGSASLEIRDLQLILERNYNIRVPGYASDELRTVKKIQPSQAWTQKLNAVQAAKVTGGKVDI